jgi:hypothetical protein
VVISVEGAREPAGTGNDPKGAGIAGGGEGVSWTSPGRPKTFFALRAKKSDVDALAAGQITIEEFSKNKLASSAYAGAISTETTAAVSYGIGGGGGGGGVQGR